MQIQMNHQDCNRIIRMISRLTTFPMSMFQFSLYYLYNFLQSAPVLWYSWFLFYIITHLTLKKKQRNTLMIDVYKHGNKGRKPQKGKHEELGNQASQAKTDVHASVRACMCLSTRCLDCIVVFAPGWRFLIQKSVCSYLFECVLLVKLLCTF